MVGWQWLVRGGDGAWEKLSKSRAPKGADTSPDWKVVRGGWTDLQNLKKKLGYPFDTLLIANYSAIFLLGGFDEKIAPVRRFTWFPPTASFKISSRGRIIGRLPLCLSITTP